MGTYRASWVALAIAQGLYMVQFSRLSLSFSLSVCLLISSSFSEPTGNLTGHFLVLLQSFRLLYILLLDSLSFTNCGTLWNVSSHEGDHGLDDLRSLSEKATSIFSSFLVLLAFFFFKFRIILVYRRLGFKGDVLLVV